MSKLSTAFNEYFYPWGDSDPDKEIWYYGKNVALKKIYEYDDYVTFRPRREKAGAAIILGGLSLIGASGYGLYKGGTYLKSKYDKRKNDTLEK